MSLNKEFLVSASKQVLVSSAIVGNLVGCATPPGSLQQAGQNVADGASSLWDKAKEIVAPNTAATSAPSTNLDPTLAYVLDLESSKRGRKIDFGRACATELASAASGVNPSGPLNNRHNGGAIPNQVQNVGRGLLNSATGGSNNVFIKGLNTLGNTGINISDATARQWQTVCTTVTNLQGRAIAANSQPVDSPSYTAQWQAIVGQAPRVVTLALNTEKGADAMALRGTNSVITDAATTGLGKIAPFGVVPRFLQGLTR